MTSRKRRWIAIEPGSRIREMVECLKWMLNERKNGATPGGNHPKPRPGGRRTVDFGSSGPEQKP